MKITKCTCRHAPWACYLQKNQQEDRWEFLIPFCSTADFCFSVIFRFLYLQDLLYQEMLTT